jgi:triosephosphate isomerase
MKRMPFIAGNWKMNKTVAEAIDLVKQLKASLSGVEGVEVAVAPPLQLFCRSKRAGRLPSNLQLRTFSGRRRGRLPGRSLLPCSKRWAAIM